MKKFRRCWCSSLPFPSLPFPSLPFPSLPFPSLPFPSPHPSPIREIFICSGAVSQLTLAYFLRLFSTRYAAAVHSSLGK